MKPATVVMPRFTEPTAETFELVMSTNRIVVVVGGDPAVKKWAGWTSTWVAYNGSEQHKREFAAVVRNQLAQVGHLSPSFGGNTGLELIVTFNFKICGRTESERQRSLWAKGDADNFAKFVQDALQGLLYDNDKQIEKITCTKVGWIGLPAGFRRVELK